MMIVVGPRCVFEGMAQVSDGGEERPQIGYPTQGQTPIGVPSAELSLSWLLASRASLRFTRHDGDSVGAWKKQEESKVAGWDGRCGCSEETLVFCPKNGVHFRVGPRH